MKEVIKEYTNGEVTIVWKPGACIHSGLCVKGLPAVFQPKEKPWIKVEAASTENLIQQVKTCPSGALSYFLNHEKGKMQEQEKKEEVRKIEVLANGPLVVHGSIEVCKIDGSTEQKTTRTTFCRCGASANKPYCDGSHRKIEFKG